MGEGLATLNLINDIRWKFQQLNIMRANIDCFVTERSGDLWHNHNFCFLGLLQLRRKDRKSHSIKCECLLVSTKLEELPNIYTSATPHPSTPPPPQHTHLARQPKQAELQLHTCYCSRLHSVRSEQFLMRFSTQHKD